uniref:Uncharacterized protein n=1 Tax=Mycena chlorophos TaxID=658473 RepID=A0ABQ0LAB7_MYCCL|nr:predicted protein [Mycena chlorophos]
MEPHGEQKLQSKYLERFLPQLFLHDPDKAAAKEIADTGLEIPGTGNRGLLDALFIAHNGALVAFELKLAHIWGLYRFMELPGSHNKMVPVVGSDQACYDIFAKTESATEACLQVIHYVDQLEIEELLDMNYALRAWQNGQRETVKVTIREIVSSAEKQLTSYLEMIYKQKPEDFRLRSTTGPGHQLFGYTIIAIARRLITVKVELDNGRSRTGYHCAPKQGWTNTWNRQMPKTQWTNRM